MEIFLIKKEADIIKIIPNYFFSHIDENNYLSKNNYFIQNKIIEKKFCANYYFMIPFKILGIIFQSMIIEGDTHTILVDNIYLSKKIW
jgi:hypothetical protein